jgi:hypothetical protein
MLFPSFKALTESETYAVVLKDIAARCEEKNVRSAVDFFLRAKEVLQNFLSDFSWVGKPKRGYLTKKRAVVSDFLVFIEGNCALKDLAAILKKDHEEESRVDKEVEEGKVIVAGSSHSECLRAALCRPQVALTHCLHPPRSHLERPREEEEDEGSELHPAEVLARNHSETELEELETSLAKDLFYVRQALVMKKELTRQIMASLGAMPKSVLKHLREKGAISEAGSFVRSIAFSEQLDELAVPADIDKLVVLGVVHGSCSSMK